MKTIYLVASVLFCVLLTGAPVSAKLAIMHQQKIIFVEQIRENSLVVSAEDGTYKIGSAEVLKKVRKLVKQNARILYVEINDTPRIVDIRPATDPPFDVAEQM